MTIDAIYITLSVADIFFNSLICLLIYKDTSMRKPFHILLLNLSLTNILSALAIQPYIWIDFSKLRGNSMARFQCAISVGLAFFAPCGVANVLTLSAITVIRYLSIVKNHQGRLITSSTIVANLCIMTWVIGAATNIPNGLSFQYSKIEAICYRRWPKGINGSLYSLLTALIFGLLPIVLAVICYTALVAHVWKRSIEDPGRNIAAVRARKKVTILLGLLLLTLILCWSPVISLWVLGRAFGYFPNDRGGEYRRQRLLRISTIFALLNCTLDPFIYIFSCPEYRKGIKKLICAPWRRQVSTNSLGAFTVGGQPRGAAESKSM